MIQLTNTHVTCTFIGLIGYFGSKDSRPTVSFWTTIAGTLPHQSSHKLPEQPGKSWQHVRGRPKSIGLSYFELVTCNVFVSFKLCL